MPTTGCASRPSPTRRCWREDTELGDPDRRRSGGRHPHHPRQRHRHEPRGGDRATSAPSRARAPPSSSSRLSGDQQKDSQLIGQFGVGFYSAFIVADRVEVLTRARPARRAEAGVHWESSADGEFTVETVDARRARHHRHAAPEGRRQEFADSLRLRALIRRYSDHIGFPVRMRKEGEARARVRGRQPGAGAVDPPRTEIKDEEYQQFYQHIAHDLTDPLAWSHNKVEGKREYTSLLYVPGARALRPVAARGGARTEAVRAARVHHGRRRAVPAAVPALHQGRGRFERSAAERLARAAAAGAGSRGHAAAALTRRVLELLAKLAKDEPEKYATFWKEFGAVLKEGLAEDHANREQLLPLLRFASTARGRRTTPDGQPRRLRGAHEEPARSASTSSSPRAWRRRAAARISSS